MNKDKKVDYASIAEKPGQEILDMIKRKEISPPTKGEDKQKFLAFAQTEVGSPERATLLKELGTPAPDTTPVGTTTVPPVDETKPIEDLQDTAAAPAAASSGTIDDLISELGYKDPKELVSAFTGLRETSAKLQSALNNANSSAGRLGREKHNLETELEKINTRLKEVEEKAKPKEMDPPAMPDMPDPKKFGEGALDDGYIDAMSKWRNDMVEFQKKSIEFSNSVKPSWAKEMEASLSDVSTKLGNVDKRTSDISQDTATSQFNRAWGEFWDKEVVGLQTQFGLQTTVPYKTINENKLIIENADGKDADGNPIYAPAQVEAATKWFNALPETDRKAFSKTAKLLRVTHNFEGETPVRRYQRDPRSAIIDAGLETDFPLFRQSSSGGASSPSPDSVKPMPASGIGANDPSLSAPQGKPEMQNRLKDIMQMARKNPSAFKQNTELVNEYRTLAAKLGYKIPK